MNKYLSIVLLASISHSYGMENNNPGKQLDEALSQTKIISRDLRTTLLPRPSDNSAFPQQLLALASNVLEGEKSMKECFKDRYRTFKNNGMSKQEFEKFATNDINEGMRYWHEDMFNEGANYWKDGEEHVRSKELVLNKIQRSLEKAKREILLEYPWRRTTKGLESLPRQSLITVSRLEPDEALIPCADVPVKDPDALRFIAYDTFLPYSISSGSSSSSSSSGSEEDLHDHILENGNRLMKGDLAPDGWTEYARERHKLEFKKGAITANTGLFGWGAADHVLEIKRRMDELSTAVARNVVITPENNLKRNTRAIREAIKNTKEALEKHYDDTYNN